MKLKINTCTGSLSGGETTAPQIPPALVPVLVELVRKYGPKAVEMAVKYGPEAVEWVKKEIAKKKSDGVPIGTLTIRRKDMGKSEGDGDGDEDKIREEDICYEDIFMI